MGALPGGGAPVVTRGIIPDEYPFYYQEDQPIGSVGTTENQIVFTDIPRVPSGFFLDSERMTFRTKLVGVREDKSYIEWKDIGTNFEWHSNAISSTSDGIIFYASDPNDTVGIVSGGVFGIQTDLIPESVRGDYNNDNVIDAADYVQWCNGLGTTYTQADFDVWRAHFGQAAGSSAALSSAEPLPAAIPEPPTKLVCLMAIVVTPFRRHSKMWSLAHC